VALTQDSAYISSCFIPEENNSVTVWIALDDVDAESGSGGLRLYTVSHTVA
jgi:ectoine hydroxylase-related dioxygenase (phytanoyl-CoA dioxygenase family)